MRSAISEAREMTIETGSVALPAIVGVPENAFGLVLFAHGSGSSRLSTRNAAVAGHLRDAGLGTVLFDLLTDDESRDRRNVFDVELLADRLLLATAWARSERALSRLPIGYFGASTGAAAALIAAARDREIGAVVSRGGRPDMAMDVLDAVTAPTLLIVGGADEGVLELNEAAYKRLLTTKRLEIVPRAGHLFEEPGALDLVADLARDWFMTHLRA